MTSNSEERLSNLELVTRVDIFPYYTEDPESYRKLISNFYYFMISGFPKPFGYSEKYFVQALTWDPSIWTLNHDNRTLTLHSPSNTFESRTKAMQSTLRHAHERHEHPELSYWHHELFPVYSHTGEHVLDIDGCGCDSFGIKTYAVHLIGYTRSSSSNEIEYWVPRRDREKMSYPGMLDTTVGGSLRSRESPLDFIVRETEEETAIPQEYTRKHIKSVGTVSLQLGVKDSGELGCQFQTSYVYVMEIEEGLIPRPNDGEVEEFIVMGLEEVRERLAIGEFKLNCGAFWMDFLVRNGIVDAENERHLPEICARLHRNHDLFII